MTAGSAVSAQTLARAGKGPWSVRLIIDRTARYYGYRPRELRERTSCRNINLARQVAMFVAREKTAVSYDEIGKFLERDRTTVIHGCNVVRDVITADPQCELAMQITDLLRNPIGRQRAILRARKTT